VDHIGQRKQRTLIVMPVPNPSGEGTGFYHSSSHGGPTNNTRVPGYINQLISVVAPEISSGTLVFIIFTLNFKL